MPEFKKINYKDFIDTNRASFNDIVEAFKLLDDAFNTTEKNIKKRSSEIENSLISIIDKAKETKKKLEEINVDGAESEKELRIIEKALEALRAENKKLKDEKNNLSEVEKDLNKERKKQARLLAKEANQTEEIVKANAKLNLELQQSNKERKKLLKVESTQIKIKDKDVKITKAQEGSIDELNGVLSINIGLYNKLTKEQRENTEVGGQLLETIKAQDEELKSLKKEYGDTKLSVGNYKESVIEALNETVPFAGSIQNLGAKFKTLKSGIGGAVGALGKVKAAVLATGLGALLLVLAAVSTALSKTREGSEALRRTTAGLGGMVNVAVGAFGQWGNRLLGISKASDKAADSTKSLWEQMVEAGENAARIEGIAIHFERIERAVSRATIALKNQSQLYQDIQENDTKGYAARIEASKEAGKAIRESFENELFLIKKRTALVNDRLKEDRRAGINDKEALLAQQEVLAQNAEAEAEYLDFVRNQTELRGKLRSDEAESLLDIAVFVNESLKEEQRQIIDNEKSTTKERAIAILELERIQSESLKGSKQDIIDYVNLTRDENIKLTQELIKASQEVSIAQGKSTKEQIQQRYILGLQLKKEIATKEKGFDLDKIINAKSTESILKQFELQGIGEKFQLRIVEFLQLERDQRLELNQIIQDNAVKENETLKSQLEFKLKAQTITNEEIKKLAEVRLEAEKKLLDDGRINKTEYNNAILKEEKDINTELLKDKEATQIKVLTLRKEYGKLTKTEINILINYELKETKKLLDAGLISLTEFNAKKKEISKQFLKDTESDEIAALNLRIKIGDLDIEEVNRLANYRIKAQKDLYDKGLISEEQYQKIKSDAIKKATEENIKQETLYRQIAASPIAQTLVNESIKQIQNEVIKAGLLGYTNALQAGKKQPQAAKAGFTALATAQIIKSFAKTQKKEGGTVMGAEGMVWMNEEGPEFVINHETTKTLGLSNNANMGDFHSRLSGIQNEGYMQAMSEMSNKIMSFENNISHSYPSAKEIGKEVSNSIPYAKLKFFEDHISLLIQSENRRHKEIVFKNRKRHL